MMAAQSRGSAKALSHSLKEALQVDTSVAGDGLDSKPLGHPALPDRTVTPICPEEAAAELNGLLVVPSVTVSAVLSGLRTKRPRMGRRGVGW